MATAVQQIAQIDRNIEGVRRELFRRVGRFNTLCIWGWHLAWNRNPDLHARQTELYRLRGLAQQERDALIEKEYRAAQRRQRATYRKAA